VLRGGSGLAYPLLLSVCAIDAAGYSVIAPVLPELEEATGAGPAELGLLVATLSLTMLLGLPLAGALVRRWNARLVLALGLALVAIGTVGMIVGESLAAYFPARAVTGVGAAGVWLGVVFSTLERWPGEAYVCMSRIVAAYSVGGVLGLALGAIGGVRGPFVAYLCLVAAAIPAVLLLLGNPAREAQLGSGRAALRLPGFVLATAIVLFAWVGFGVLEGVLPLLFGSRLEQATIAAILVCTSLVIAASAALAARFRPLPVVYVAAPLAIGGVALAGAVDTVALWTVALIAIGAGLGACTTGSMGILLDTVGRERIVLPMVVWSQAGILGYLLGPALGGLVADALGYGAIGLVPLAFAAVAGVAALHAAPWRGGAESLPGER
jgi:MFS family permease